MQFSYYRRPLFLLLLGYAAAIFLFNGYFFKPPPALPFELPRGGALIEGRIAEYPVFNRGRWRFALDTVRLYGAPFGSGLMVDAQVINSASYGDRVEFLADLSEPSGSAAPGSLDWAGFLGRRGIRAQARAGEVAVTRQAGRVVLLARAFRARVLGTFEKNMSSAAASVLAGVVIGEKKSVPPDIKAAFQDSGAMHLLVASGSNVGFVVVVVYALCARLGWRRKYAGLAAMLLAGFYVLVSGLDAPLVRAYLMFSAGLAAFILRRSAGAFHALTVAALVILAVSPRALFDASFQMSFLAAYGLTAGMAIWKNPLNEILRSRLKALAAALGFKSAVWAGLAVKVADLFLISFFAQLFLYPLLALYFHRISAVSLLSNMVLVPASGLAMALGFAMALFSGAGFVFTVLCRVGAVFMDLFIGAVKLFASLPFSAFSIGEPSGWGIAGFYVAAFYFLHAPLLGFKNMRLYAGLAAGFGVMVAGRLQGPLPAGAHTCQAALFADARTRCALVTLPGGELFMVNPGLSAKILAGAVFAGGVRSLEAVAVTSLEEKNFSGLAGLWRLVGIKRIILPYGPQPAGLRALLDDMKNKGALVEKMWPGETGGRGIKIFPVWSENSRGYTGRADVYDWEIGPVRIEAQGGAAARLCAPENCAPQDRVEAQRGKTVILKF